VDKKGWTNKTLCCLVRGDYWSCWWIWRMYTYYVSAIMKEQRWRFATARPALFQERGSNGNIALVHIGHRRRHRSDAFQVWQISKSQMSSLFSLVHQGTVVSRLMDLSTRPHSQRTCFAYPLGIPTRCSIHYPFHNILFSLVSSRLTLSMLTKIIQTKHAQGYGP